MAVIEQVIDTLTFSSKYSCRDKYDYFDTAYTESDESWETHDVTVTTASIDTQSLTFSYNSIENETINMVVFSMESIGTTYGGTVWVNDEIVYKSSDMYVAYLDPSIVGTESTEITVKFQSYTPSHYHKSDYDSVSNEYNYDTTEGAYGGAVYTKNHEGVLVVNNITLKIYTGDDFVSAPSTSSLFAGVNDTAKKVTDIFIGVNGVAKKVSDAWIGVNGIARKFWPCLELKDVPAGSIIQLDEAGDGVLVDYIIVAQNHYLNDTNTEGHTVFMRKPIVNTKSKYGNNEYGQSYDGEALDVFVNNTWKASLDGKIIMKLMDITIPCTRWDSPYTSSITRQIWVPARAEIDNSSDWVDHHEAPCFTYFETITTNAARIAYTDSGSASAWWTRSCVEGTNPYVRVVNENGVFTNYGQTASTGVRPVFCLPNSLPVSKISEGIYDLIL